MARRLFLLGLLLLISRPVPALEPDGLQDPMRPVRYQAPAADSAGEKDAAEKQRNWRLSAVLISAERTLAVINGRSLQVGDQLDGFRLVEITPTQAVLKNKQKQIVLRRAGTGLKKASSLADVEKGSHP